jgi:hypothetical protein
MTRRIVIEGTDDEISSAMLDWANATERWYSNDILYEYFSFMDDVVARCPSASVEIESFPDAAPAHHYYKIYSSDKRLLRKEISTNLAEIETEAEKLRPQIEEIEKKRNHERVVAAQEAKAIEKQLAVPKWTATVYYNQTYYYIGVYSDRKIKMNARGRAGGGCLNETNKELVKRLVDFVEQEPKLIDEMKAAGLTGLVKRISRLQKK